jgi:hypothetical protein
MSNSLIITFNELVKDLGVDSYSVSVNGHPRTTQNTDVDGIYSTYLETYDVVTISIDTSPSGLLRVINVIRRDYTTDDIAGDNGIRDTFISSSSGTTGTTYFITFTATTIESCYNYEYRVTITTDINVSCEIEGTALGTPVLPPIINDNLIIYTNGYSYTGSTGGTTRYWLDSRGNYNGGCPGTNSATPPIWKIYNTGFFELNNYGINFTNSIPPANSGFTFGGWIQTVQSSDITLFYSAGELKLYKNSSNYWSASAQWSIYGDIIYATSSTLLNSDSNIWNYIICKWTPGDSLKVYLNGLLIVSTTTAITTLTNLNRWYIGPASNTNVSDFEVYYTSLTDAQILFNFNQLKFFYGY